METVTEKQTSPVGSHAEIIQAQPQTTAPEAKAEPEPVAQAETTPEPLETEGEPAAEPPAAFVGENLFDGPAPSATVPAESPTQKTSTAKPGVIGPGKAKRLRAIAHAKKTRTDAEFDELKRVLKIQHLEDMPISSYEAAEKWAEGRE